MYKQAERGLKKDQNNFPSYVEKFYHWTPEFFFKIMVKGIFSDSNNIFLWYESEDTNKKCLFPKFQLIPILHFQVMHDYVYFIAPIDYCAE